MVSKPSETAVRNPQRRSMLHGIVTLSGGAMVVGLQGCAWISDNARKTQRHGESTEEISSMLVSADGAHLVFLTTQSHYLFEAPPALVTALRATYKPILTASIGRLDVDLDGKAQVPYQLELANPTQAQAEQARQDGFRDDHSAVRLTGVLKGMRYASNGVSLDQSLALNRTYVVTVRRELRGYEYVDLPSPIRATAEGGLAIVLAPLAIVASIILLPVLLVMLPAIKGGVGAGVGP